MAPSSPFHHRDDDSSPLSLAGRQLKLPRRLLPVLLLAAIVGPVVKPSSATSTTTAGDERMVPRLDDDDNEGPERWYHDQLVDHFSNTTNEKWSQRYYTYSRYFDGPGSPIFVNVGGEGPIGTGHVRSFVKELARTYRAYVVTIEHRFYGQSQPVPDLPWDAADSGPVLQDLLTPAQALSDYVRLVRHLQLDQLGCTLKAEKEPSSTSDHEVGASDIKDVGESGRNGAESRRSSNSDDGSYCPVVTIGGSYPGFLSAMMRLIHPDVVDAAYAASAPMKFYAQQVDQDGYYERITESARRYHPSCPDAVRGALMDVSDALLLSPARSARTATSKEATRDVNSISNVEGKEMTTATNGNEAVVSSPNNKKRDDYLTIAHRLGVCNGTVPSYITNASTFHDEIMMVIGYTFANHNMGNYPPGKGTKLFRDCVTFLPDALDEVVAEEGRTFFHRSEIEADGDGRTMPSLSPSSLDKVRKFLLDEYGDDGVENAQEQATSATSSYSSSTTKPSCFNMSAQSPDGEYGTISAGDWSGVGSGNSGRMWDFQTCTLLVEAIGFSNESMFPPRRWSMEWLRDHCQRRFNILPSPNKLVNEWNFDELVEQNSSRIVFTNGMNDGWSVGAVTKNLSNSLVAMNFPNGAHHSDLFFVDVPLEDMTPDVREGQLRIIQLLGEWLRDIQSSSLSARSTQTNAGVE